MMTLLQVGSHCPVCHAHDLVVMIRKPDVCCVCAQQRRHSVLLMISDCVIQHVQHGIAPHITAQHSVTKHDIAWHSMTAKLCSSLLKLVFI